MRELKYLVAVALLAMSAVLMAGAAYGADDWTVTGQDLPSAMVWDASAAASVDADNSGDTTWDSDYALVSVMGPTETPTAIDRWGLTAVPVEGTVAPAASYTWDFDVTAPPISTLAYTAPVGPTDSGIVVGFDDNWMLAHPYDPPTFVTTDMAAGQTVITKFPDDLGGYTFWIEELAGRTPLVVAGYPDGYYRSTWIVTRDQMAVYMARALNLPTAAYEGFFEDTDVPESQWAWPWIEALVREDIVRGYPDGYYRPGWNVDRGSMAAYVAFGINGDRNIPSGPAVGHFTDVADWDPGPAHPYYDMIEFTVAHNVVQGYGDGTYRPAVNVTRDQMAVFVWKGFVMPTGAVVVLAGPAVTAVDTGAAEYDGWSSAASGLPANPGTAYIGFDATRFAEDMDSFDVTMALYDPADIDANGLPEEGATPVADNGTVTVSTAEINTARTAALASGNPYMYVTWDIPADLDPGVYTLVATINGEVWVKYEPTFIIGTPTTVLSEGFEGSVLPDGWAVEDLNGDTSQWGVSTIASDEQWQMGCSPDNHVGAPTGVPDGTYALTSWPNADNSGWDSGNSGQVTTPAYDCSGLATVTLAFSGAVAINDGEGSNGDFQYSVDGGTTWNSVNEDLTDGWCACCDGSGWRSPDGYIDFRFDMTAEMAGQSDVRLRWVFTGGCCWGWVVDSVNISGFG